METEDGRIEILYDQFCTFVEQPDGLSGDALHAILMHPVSQQKLEFAAASLLKRASQRRDLIADLKQEAFLLVMARFRDGTIRFQREGPSRFAGWLWRLWHRACRDAWHRLKPTFEHERLSSCHCCVEPTKSRYPREMLWHVMLSAIDEIDDETLREVMIDWIEGLNCVQSGRRQCLSPGTVNRRRGRGVAAVRRIIGPSLSDYSLS